MTSRGMRCRRAIARRRAQSAIAFLMDVKKQKCFLKEGLCHVRLKTYHKDRRGTRAGAGERGLSEFCGALNNTFKQQSAPTFHGALF